MPGKVTAKSIQIQLRNFQQHYLAAAAASLLQAVVQRFELLPAFKQIHDQAILPRRGPRRGRNGYSPGKIWGALPHWREAVANSLTTTRYG